ncbi:MAG: hypothetical protein LBT44_05990 [Clostridiales bacterium]|nr:hypothetical protein [Clostridiales bacterium]
MERSHYRRTRPVGDETARERRETRQPTGTANPAGQAVKFSERLISQFIVCGLIMAAVLVISLLDTSFTRKAAGSILSAIRAQTTAEDAKQAWVKARDSARNLLGGAWEDITAQAFTSGESSDKQSSGQSSGQPSGGQSSGQSSAGFMDISVQNAPSSDADADFRIDEDILTQIESGAGFDGL